MQYFFTKTCMLLTIQPLHLFLLGTMSRGQSKLLFNNLFLVAKLVTKLLFDNSMELLEFYSKTEGNEPTNRLLIVPFGVTRWWILGPRYFWTKAKVH